DLDLQQPRPPREHSVQWQEKAGELVVDKHAKATAGANAHQRQVADTGDPERTKDAPVELDRLPIRWHDRISEQELRSIRELPHRNTHALAVCRVSVRRNLDVEVPV